MPTRNPEVLATDPTYVLPTRPPTPPRLVEIAPPSPDAAADFARVCRRGGAVAKALGARFVAAAENLRVFTAELRSRLGELDGAIAEATRAQIKGALRGAFDVLDWCDVAHDDLLAQSRRAAGGEEPIDVLVLCEEVAGPEARAERPVHVHGVAGAIWWGEAEALATAVRGALRLASERALGSGARSIEVRETAQAVFVEVCANGDCGPVAAESVVAFRRAAAAIGARVLPTGLGAAAPGLVLALPKSTAGDGA
ncbi:MAG: hypothetical protein ACK595_05090 [Planctomycetota bacterium]